MDPFLIWSIRIFFIVAALAPLALVVRYIWKEVPLRRAEVDRAVNGPPNGDEVVADKTALEIRKPGSRQAVLDANPFISNPRETFERYHHVGRYIIPIVLLTFMMAASAYIAYAWVIHRLVPLGGGGDPGIPGRIPLVMVMALAGGMVWTLQQVMVRVYDGELGPPDLMEITVGLFAAVPIGFAFSLVTAEVNELRSFMAFAASAFPVRETSRVIRQFVTRKMLDSSPATVSRPAECHLGTAINGVSDAALARLAELRIVTALDMAYSDPVKVMVTTGFPLQVIIDWIDQALWSLYAGDKREAMTRLGLRCSLDVCEFADMHLREKSGRFKAVDELSATDRAALDAVATKLDSNAALVVDMFCRICNDPQVIVIRHLWYQRGVPPDLMRRDVDAAEAHVRSA